MRVFVIIIALATAWADLINLNNNNMLSNFFNNLFPSQNLTSNNLSLGNSKTMTTGMSGRSISSRTSADGTKTTIQTITSSDGQKTIIETVTKPDGTRSVSQTKIPQTVTTRPNTTNLISRLPTPASSAATSTSSNTVPSTARTTTQNQDIKVGASIVGRSVQSKLGTDGTRTTIQTSTLSDGSRNIVQTVTTPDGKTTVTQIKPTASSANVTRANVSTNTNTTTNNNTNINTNTKTNNLTETKTSQNRTNNTLGTTNIQTRVDPDGRKTVTKTTIGPDGRKIVSTQTSYQSNISSNRTTSTPANSTTSTNKNNISQPISNLNNINNFDDFFKSFNSDFGNGNGLNPPINLTSRETPSEKEKAQLKIHNYYRDLHGVPPLQISQQLTTIAQNYANQLNARNGFSHSNNKYNGRPLGQNLYMSYPAPNGGQASRQWYNQIALYRWDGAFSSTTGHFTQLVWKDTKYVGFGYSGGIVVANYYPAGNVMGRFQQNVFKPVK